jgi:thiamine-monophosphate kinase
MHEFQWIDRYLRPLTKGFDGAFNLSDDTALLHSAEGLVTTTDTMVQGIHFMGDESPALLARKLLRVNLSDLAATGAQPYAYLLNLSLPKSCDEGWMQSFAGGLMQDQDEFSIWLAGGDTTTSPALVLTITAFGLPGGHGLKQRSHAGAGEDIWVTGTLGDAALGLHQLKGHLAGTSGQFISRYRLPQPRLATAQALAPYIHACTDISDGLMADMRNICRASNKGAALQLAALPLSDEAAAILVQHRELKTLPATGGDDYELLFTASPADAEAIRTIAMSLAHGVTRIGTVTEGKSLHLLDDSQTPILLDREGYVHGK